MVSGRLTFPPCQLWEVQVSSQTDWAEGCLVPVATIMYSILLTLFGTVCGRHDDVPLIQWVGTTEWQVPHLKAQERLSVLRHICFTSPDVYHISPLVHVSTVRPSSGRSTQNAPPIYVPQTCPQSAVITVINRGH